MSNKTISFSEWDKSLEVIPNFPLLEILKKNKYPRSCSFKVCKKNRDIILKYQSNNDPIYDFDDGCPYQIISGSLSTRKKHLDYRFQISSHVGTLVAGRGGCARSSFHFVLKKTPKGPVVRYLSPEECEQIQGWPIGHTKQGATKKLSFSQRYDLIGNGISSIVSKTLIEELTQGSGANILSLFAGGGGTELLLDKEKYPVVAYSEIKTHALDILKKIHPEADNLGSVLNIEGYRPSKEIGLITGGFPCQSYSYVGSRKGLHDERGKLFYALAYAILKFKPQFALLENVLGILTIDKGETIKTLKGVLMSIGYDVETRVCDSSDFGLRQARKRVFFLLRKNGKRVSKFVRDNIVKEFHKIKENGL